MATWMTSTKDISQEPSSILLGAYEFSGINIISIPKSFLTGIEAKKTLLQGHLCKGPEPGTLTQSSSPLSHSLCKIPQFRLQGHDPHKLGGDHF